MFWTLPIYLPKQVRKVVNEKIHFCAHQTACTGKIPASNLGFQAFDAVVTNNEIY